MPTGRTEQHPLLLGPRLGQSWVTSTCFLQLQQARQLSPASFPADSKEKSSQEWQVQTQGSWEINHGSKHPSYGFPRPECHGHGKGSWWPWGFSRLQTSPASSPKVPKAPSY